MPILVFDYKAMCLTGIDIIGENKVSERRMGSLLEGVNGVGLPLHIHNWVVKSLQTLVKELHFGLLDVCKY